MVVMEIMTYEEKSPTWRIGDENKPKGKKYKLGVFISSPEMQ
jgi:hypothetical protein